MIKAVTKSARKESCRCGINGYEFRSIISGFPQYFTEYHNRCDAGDMQGRGNIRPTNKAPGGVGQRYSV